MMTKKEIVKMHICAGWEPQRRTELPKSLAEYLSENEVDAKVIKCLQSLFGLVVRKPNWKKYDNITYDFGPLNEAGDGVISSNMRMIIEELPELKTLWKIDIKTPVPLFKNFRDSEGVNEMIFFDKFGNFFAQGDDLYYIGSDFWEAINYAMSEPLPYLSPLGDNLVINKSLAGKNLA